MLLLAGLFNIFLLLLLLSFGFTSLILGSVVSLGEKFIPEVYIDYLIFLVVYANSGNGLYSYLRSDGISNFMMGGFPVF